MSIRMNDQTTETMTASELIGRLVELRVLQTPCIIRADGHEPLTETVFGYINRFVNMPGGPIGFLTALDGRKIAFDAGCDIKAGKIEVVLPRDEEAAA